MIDRVNLEARNTLAQPDVRKRLVESGGADDAERYRRVVQQAGVKPG